MFEGASSVEEQIVSRARSLGKLPQGIILNGRPGHKSASDQASPFTRHGPYRRMKTMKLRATKYGLVFGLTGGLCFGFLMMMADELADAHPTLAWDFITASSGFLFVFVPGTVAGLIADLLSRDKPGGDSSPN